MGVYDRQIATAKRQIAAKGRKVIWREYNDAEPEEGGVAWKPTEVDTTDHTVAVLFLPDSGPNRAFMRAITGADAVTGQDYGLMASVGFEPTVNDRIYAVEGVGTENETLLRTIVDVDPLAPNGDIILYTIRFET